MQTIKINFECKKVEITCIELQIPLQLNCKFEPDVPLMWLGESGGEEDGDCGGEEGGEDSGVWEESLDNEDE